MIVDTPRQAKWLTPDEQEWLSDTLTHEESVKLTKHAQHGFWRSLAGWRTLALAFIYYSKSVAIYVLAFFSPAIVAALGDNLSNTAVGFLTAIPYVFAAAFMVFWARHSDRTQERRWHVAIPLFTAGLGLVLMVFTQDSIVLSLVLLTVITTAVYATYGPFWSLPSLFMTGSAAAVGMASINSIANLGGFVGPFGFGALEDATGNIYTGLAIVSTVLVIAAALVVRLRFVREAEALARRVVLEEDPTLAGNLPAPVNLSTDSQK